MKDELAILKTSLEALDDMIKVQCSDGNWNYNSYMHGMANGMIFVKSLFDDKPPEYLKAPEVWLSDLPNKEVVAQESVSVN